MKREVVIMTRDDIYKTLVCRLTDYIDLAKQLVCEIDYLNDFIMWMYDTKPISNVTSRCCTTIYDAAIQIKGFPKVHLMNLLSMITDLRYHDDFIITQKNTDQATLRRYFASTSDDFFKILIRRKKIFGSYLFDFVTEKQKKLLFSQSIKNMFEIKKCEDIF